MTKAFSSHLMFQMSNSVWNTKTTEWSANNDCLQPFPNTCTIMPCQVTPEWRVMYHQSSGDKQKSHTIHTGMPQTSKSSHIPHSIWILCHPYILVAQQNHWWVDNKSLSMLFYETCFSANHRDLKNKVYHSPFFFFQLKQQQPNT